MTKLALQLYSVRGKMEQDPIGTIKKAAEIGYKYIEVANHDTKKDKGIGFGVSAEKMNETLRECGVQVISAHLDPFDDLEILCDYQKAIGNHNIVYSRDYYHCKDDILRRADWLNRTGEKAAKYGVTLHYHNHFHEFQALPGCDKTIYDMLVELTDPALVKIQIDTFWAFRGGADPVKLIEDLGERCTLVHQKDFTAGYEKEINLFDQVYPGEKIDRSTYDRIENPLTFTEPGSGIMDIQAIIDACNKNKNFEYMILEQDHTQLDEIDSIRKSYECFKKFSGIEI